MKNTRKIIRRTMVILISAALTAGSIPVSAASEFSSGSEEPVVSEDLSVLEDVFGDPQKDEEFSAQISEDTFISGTEQHSTLTDAEDTDQEALAELDYIKGRPLTEEERAEQFAPMQNLQPLGEVPSIESNLDTGFGMGRSSYYPAKYDARELGLVTPVKNQEPFGICWAFGMASLLETSLLAQGKGTYDLSEEHLAYFFSNRVNDPLGNTANDKNNHLWGYHNGGNDYLASIFLSTWSGMTTEADVPLPTDSSHVKDYSSPISPSKAYNAAAYLTEASFSEYSVERMKQMLTERNSVSIMYYTVDKYLNPDTAAYSCPQKFGTNHIVTVVGWDDDYSRKNFASASAVTSDGAWIAKNSWGTKWGKDGYFYLSYEDANIGSLVSVEAVDSVKYSNNYFYDGSSSLNSIILKSGQSAANIFTASAGKGKAEILGEINVTTFSDDAEYDIQVYTSLKDASDPTSGIPAYETPYKVYQSMAGVHTIAIPEVSLIPETKFSVVITNAGDKTIKFCCEASANYTNWFSCTASVKEGQGFYRGLSGSKWRDLYLDRVTPRIKAHTRTEKGEAPMAMSFTSAKISINAGEKVDTKAMITPDEMAGYELAFTSSDKNVAKVSASGVVTAVSAGTAVITCTSKASKDLSASVTVNVSLAKPSFSVKAYSSGYNKISWSKVAGAGGYRIYRKIPGKNWSLVAKVGSSAASWTDKKAAALQSYQYTIRAYRTYKGKTYMSKYTAGEVIKTSPVTQKVSSVTSVSSGIKIRWKPQKKCDGYRIYRKEKGGSWKVIKTLSKGSCSNYTDKTAKKSKTYYYAVRAYVKEPYGRLYSTYKASKAVIRK